MSWFEDKGSDGDVVISSRIRLARNFEDLPFPDIMSIEQARMAIKRCREALLDNNSALSPHLDFIDLNTMNDIERQALVEKHLMSPDLAKDYGKGALILKKDYSISIMINEEDHIRIQCFSAGLNLEETWDTADKIDDLLEENVSYAFDEELGYITSCPTNVGTGMRVSVMMHLPALVKTGNMNNVIENITKLGVTVRGIYGEGTQALGDIFQISNQVTIGRSERDIIGNIKGLATELVNAERSTREALLQSSRVQIEDMVWRAYGLLTNARVLTSDEALRLLSDVRMGVNMGIVDIPVTVLNKLLIMTRPANLQLMYSSEIEPYERDFKRAEYVKEILKKRNGGV
ncbi:MAG: protein arginine kinase [Thermoanaerobacteraceae bacterium]|nr:protein arginine kinase [Thermoanaerobacteraceae bacterium]